MAFILIEPWDFTKPLYGNGCLTVADSLLRRCGERLRIVGSTSGSEPLGRWRTIEAYGHSIPFLPVARASAIERPWIRSSNVQFAISLSRHFASVRCCPERAVFTRTYSVLWALLLRKSRWDICFYFPGLENPLRVGKRSRLGWMLAPVYEWLQLRATARISCAFAPASHNVIDAYNSRLARIQSATRVRFVPTAVDLEQFRPSDQTAARRALGIGLEGLVVTHVGRLAEVKGLPFLFQAMQRLKQRQVHARLLAVGDGELRRPLEALVERMHLTGSVYFLGKVAPSTVAAAINAADVCVCGSVAEGISNATLEELACGKPIVSTRVSGIDLLVRDGVNGYVVEGADPVVFADRVLRAKELLGASLVSREIVEKGFSDDARWNTIESLWAPMAQPFRS
jgi:glycosyltransferase involved in cell wall biosynthesis